MITAAAWGCRRQINSIDKNLKPWGSHQSVAELWYSNIIGAMAEFVAAKALDKFVGPNLLQFSRPDLTAVGVRWTQYDHGKLFLYKDKDTPSINYVLVVGHPPNFRIAGFILGKDGMNEKYFDESLKYPAYAIEQKYLRPVSEFNTPKIVEPEFDIPF